MANTYILINSISLGSSAASVTFSAIPATYDDLLLVANARSDNPSNSERVDITFNSITSNYSSTRLVGNGSTASSGRVSSQPTFASFYDNAANSTSNTFSIQQYYIPKYASSINKVMSDFSAMENNATTAFTVVSAHLLRNTAVVTSITLTDGASSTLATGSSFYLYGIKNS